MRDTVFFRQAELLLRILPLVHKEEAFALKGGTAGMGLIAIVLYLLRDVWGSSLSHELPPGHYRFPFWLTSAT